MHYKNGRQAKIGDKILVTPQGGQPFVGVLIEASPGSTTCNGQVAPLPLNLHWITLSEHTHLDDVKVIPAAP